MRSLVFDIEFPELDRFKKLHYAIMDAICSLLTEYLEPTQQMIRNLIAIEDAYINVNNPDFILARDATLNIFKSEKPQQSEFQQDNGGARSMYSNNREEKMMEERKQVLEDDEITSETYSPKDNESQNAALQLKNSDMHALTNKFSVGYEAISNMKNRVQNVDLSAVPKRMRIEDEPGSREMVETQVLKNCLVSYFNIVRKHINDLVPKTIMAFLVNKSKETAQ